MNKKMKVISIIAISLLIGVSVGYLPFHIQGTNKERTKDTEVSKYQACENSVNQLCVVAGNVSYNQTDLKIVYSMLSNNNTGIQSGTQFYLWSPSFYQQNSSVNYNFSFQKSEYFISSYYPGNPASENWAYPVTTYFAVMNNLLLVYTTVDYWYTGPYGFQNYSNVTAGLSAGFTFSIFASSGNYSYGFSDYFVMNPPTLYANDTLKGSYVPWLTNNTGYYGYSYIESPSSSTGNSSFWINQLSNVTFPAFPNSTQCQLIGSKGYTDDQFYTRNESGPYSAPANNTTSWVGKGLILGSYYQPYFTSFIYIINMSKIKSQFGIIDGNHYIDLKFNLNTVLASYPPKYICNDSYDDLYSINSEWPINSIYSIDNYSTYLRVIL